MHKKSLRNKYRDNLLALHFITITVISFVEVVACIVFSKKPWLIEISPMRFLNYNVVLPIIINYTAHVIARLLVLNKKVSDVIKESAVVFATYVTATCIAMIHRNYILTLCSFVFPIVLSGFFNNKKLLNWLTLFSAISLMFVTFILLIESHITTSLVVNIMMAYVYILIAYFSSHLAIRFSDRSFNEIKNQTEYNSQLQEQMRLDRLTGVFNHDAFDEDFNIAINRFKTRNLPFCLAIIDLDDFKRVNDTYGHGQGNTVLIELTDTLYEHCLISDKIYRYGGEEFAIIFSGRDKDSSLALMEKMLDDFGHRTYPFTDTPITFSAGLDDFDGESSAKDFFNHVDNLLYTAKRTGKNRIVSEAQ